MPRAGLAGARELAAAVGNAGGRVGWNGGAGTGGTGTGGKGGAAGSGAAGKTGGGGAGAGGTAGHGAGGGSAGTAGSACPGQQPADGLAMPIGHGVPRERSVLLLDGSGKYLVGVRDAVLRDTAQSRLHRRYRLPDGRHLSDDHNQVLQSTLDDLSCLVQRDWGHVRDGHDLFAGHEGRRRLRLRAVLCNAGYTCPAGFQCAAGTSGTDAHGCEALPCSQTGCPTNFVCKTTATIGGCTPKPCSTDCDCDQGSASAGPARACWAPA